MALEKFTAAAAELKVKSDALIANCQGHEAELAAANSALAAVDDNATAAIQPVIDAIGAALAAPEQPAA